MAILGCSIDIFGPDTPNVIFNVQGTVIAEGTGEAVAGAQVFLGATSATPVRAPLTGLRTAAPDLHIPRFA
jgi:hypothetical protein